MKTKPLAHELQAARNAQRTRAKLDSMIKELRSMRKQNTKDRKALGTEACPLIRDANTAGMNEWVLDALLHSIKRH